MRLRNSSTRFGAVAQFLHWLVAGLIVYQFILAERAESATLFQKLGILATHKSVGLSVLALAVIRLLWRLSNVRPAPPPNEPVARRAVARLSHAFLYGLLLALPLSGWLMSSAANTPVSYFGWVTLPDLIAPSEAWAERLLNIHAAFFWSLATIVTFHASAALYHHFFLRDDILRRMLPSIGDST